MALRNTKKIETLSKHYRKYKQLEYEQQMNEANPRQSKTSQVSQRRKEVTPGVTQEKVDVSLLVNLK